MAGWGWETNFVQYLYIGVPSQLSACGKRERCQADPAMSELIKTLEVALSEVANFGNTKAVELLESAIQQANRASSDYDRLKAELYLSSLREA